jgi:hypothetical protein
MQPSARLILNFTGDKSYYLWNGTESYYNKLRAAYADISEDLTSEYLYFGFFTLCASTLEYSLNYILVNYCIDKFGPDNYKAYCNEYTKLSFRNKLMMTPHIVSDGKFILNEKHPSFIQLTDLISRRNKILHNKEFLNEINSPINGELVDGNICVREENSAIEFSFEVAINYIDTLTKEKCINYGNALGDFKQLIMTPALNKDLKENPMIMFPKW